MRFEVALDPRARRPARTPGRAGEPVAVPSGTTSSAGEHARSDNPDSAGDDGLDAGLAAARRGEDAGFLVLYRAIQPRLLRYLRVRGGDSADDVAAEAWLQVVRDLATFRGDADDFRAWVFTVARHR